MSKGEMLAIEETYPADLGDVDEPDQIEIAKQLKDGQTSGVIFRPDYRLVWNLEVKKYIHDDREV